MEKLSVLVVDDAASWRTFVSAILRQPGVFDITAEASDGLRAVQVAEKLKPAIILLDINLPKLNGIQAAGWIRKLAPLSKIVVLSENRDPEIARAAFALGAWAYVLKSDAGNDLIAALYSVINGTRFVSTQLAGYGLLTNDR